MALYLPTKSSEVQFPNVLSQLYHYSDSSETIISYLGVYLDELRTQKNNHVSRQIKKMHVK